MNTTATPESTLRRPLFERIGAHGREAVDVLAYIVLMFMTALAVSVALACVVLLLAAPADAAEPSPWQPSPMRIDEAGQGTLLFRDARAGTLRVPVLHTEARIQVSGTLVHTRLVQSFRNPSQDWQEGIYVFPLPDDAAVSRLRLKLGDRVIEGEIQERSRARATYQRARDAGKRAALVEQERPNIFTTSVANIAPDQLVEVELEYRQHLAYRVEGSIGRYQLRFPMVVGPRYQPGTAGATRASENEPDNRAAIDAQRTSPPVAEPGTPPLNPVTLSVRIDAGAPIGQLRSAYHRIEVFEVDAQRRQIVLTEGDTPANRDFVLNWTLDTGDAPAASAFIEPGKGGRHYALLTVMPPAPQATTRLLPREVVFVIDVSGSMEGQSIVQARRALAVALGRLRREDRFNVIAFNNVATPLFPAAVAADAKHIDEAAYRVARLQANGGTNIAHALGLALNPSHDDSRVRQIVFLTDGAVANEAQLFAQIKQGLGDSRLFTVGIGSAPNSHFMRKAALAGRGSFTYIGKVDEVGAQMAHLFAQLESPVLKNLSLRWPDGSVVDSWPRQLPDLYLGEPLVLAAEIDRASGQVELSGDTGRERWSTSLSLEDARPGSGIGSLWARRKIDGLVDRISDGADAASIRAEVIPLALEHRLVTRYTSFVAVDHTPARPQQSPLDSNVLATNLPHGWQHEAVFGELPRGATDSRLHLLLGLLGVAFSLGLMLALRRSPRRPSAWA